MDMIWRHVIIVCHFPRFNLNAVSNHVGSMDHGHYTAFCFNNAKKSWYTFDDQNVTAMARSNVVTSNAYLMFFISNN